MGYRYKYEDGSILEFSQEPTLREIEQAGINAGIVKPTLRQKFDETLMGGFQSIAKMGTGILRSGVGITAALSPTKTLADYETATKKPGVLNSIAAPFIPGSQAAKDFNAQFITPKNTYQQRGQLAGDIGQFLVAAPVTGVSNLQRLAVAPLIDTAIQVTQDVGAGTTDQKTLLSNAMLTAGTSIMAGVFMPTKKVNWLKLSASGALTGYVADVATGLTGARGEDRAGINAFIPGAGTAFGTGMGVATGALTRFSPAGQRAKIVENRINALTQLEADHPKIRAAFDNAREQGYDPINILAHTDALNDSTTRGGKIDMGKALNKLDMEMEPMEPHVYNTLKQEGITITPRQFAKGLVDMLASSRLQLDERAVLQAKIKTLIKVANDVAKKNGGKIPLYMVQARKTSLGAQIRTQYGTVKGSTNKEIVRAYKEIVEKYTQSMDVKAYNQLLQQLYTFRSVLGSLNGRVIEGGRLSRHVQTLLGSYIGGHVGGAPGAVLGYDLAYKARSGYNEKYFGQMETPTVKKGAYGIAKKATTRQESLGKQNQIQRNTATQSNAISESVPQKKGIVSRAKDAVKGAIKAYKDLPPSTKQGGFARISGEGESARGKAEQTIKGRQVSSGNDNTLAAFAASKNHEPVAEFYGKKFEIGDFGKSAGERKKTKQDRFDFSLVPDVLKNAFLVVRSGANRGSYRYGNKVFIAKQGDGFAAVYTRPNSRGNEEIINWHAIPAENMAKYLDDIGIPSRNRTDMTSLEGSQFVHLAYGDKLTIPQQLAKINESVVINERFQIIDPSKTGEEAVLGMTSDLSKELAGQVIRAKKTGNEALLSSLYPKISAELEARLLKKNAMDKALTSLAKSEANSTTRVRMPISEKFQEGTEKAFRLLHDGRTAEADARFVELGKQQLNEFKNRLKAVRLFKEGKNSPVTFSLSSVGFRQTDGYTRPTFEVNVRVAKDKQDAFYAELARSANELGLERIDSYKLVPHFSENYLGVPDKEMGVTNNPHFVGFLKKALPVSQADTIRKAQQESGLPEVTISDNGRRLDIPFIGEYSKQNYERYIQQYHSFREALDRRGISGTYKQGGAKTRTLSNNPTDRGTTFRKYQTAFYRKNPELYSKRFVSSPVVDRLRYETSITKGELTAMLDELPVTDLEKQFYNVILEGKPDTAKIGVKDLYQKIEKRGLETGVRKLTDDFSYTKYGYRGVYGKLVPDTGRKDRDMYTLFVDATSIADENRRLASHGGAKDHAVVGHVRVSPIKGKPVIKNDRVVGYTQKGTKSTHTTLEWQNDPFQESRSGEGNWATTKEFLSDRDPKTKRKQLTEYLQNRQSDLVRNKAELKLLKQQRAQLAEGADAEFIPATPVARAIYDAKKILAKIDELGATMGFRTDDSSLAADIQRIEPSGENKYKVILEYRTGMNEPLQTHTFEYETQWPITQTGGGNGMTLSNLKVRGDSSLERAIDVTSSRNPDEAPSVDTFDRQIAEKTRGIQRVIEDIADYKKKIAAIPEGTDLAAAQYIDLKEGQKYFFKVFRETIPYMYKKLKATHFTLPTLSTITATEWGRFQGTAWENLTAKRNSLRGEKQTASAPPYRYWVNGKEGTFGSGVQHRPKVTEKIELTDGIIDRGEDQVGYVIRASNGGFLYLNRKGVKLKTEKLGMVKARQLMYERYENHILEQMNVWRSNDTDLAHIPELTKDTLLSPDEIRDLARKAYYHDYVGSSKFSDSALRKLGYNPWNFRWNSEVQRSLYNEQVQGAPLKNLIYEIYANARRRYGSFNDTSRLIGRDQFDFGIMSVPWRKGRSPNEEGGQRGVSIYSDGYLYTYTWNTSPMIRSYGNPDTYKTEKSVDNQTFDEYDVFDNMTPEQLNETGDSHAGVLISYVMTQPKARAMLEQATGNKFQRIIDEGGNSQYLIELNEGVMDLQKMTFEE